MTKAENIIISGGEDGVVKIWDTKGKHNELELTKHKKSIKTCIISNDQKKIISCGFDQSIILWNIPEFDSETILNIKDIDLQQIWYSTRENRLEGLGMTSEGTSICYWDNLGQRTQIFNIFKTQAPDFSICLDDHLVVFSKFEFDANENLSIQIFNFEDNEIYYGVTVYDMVEGRKILAKIIQANVKSVYITSNREHCFVGELFRITIWDYSNFELVKIIRAHNGFVISLIANNSLTSLFTFADDKTLKKFDIFNFALEENICEEEESLSFKTDSAEYCVFKVSEDELYLYFAIKTCFKIFLVNDMVTIITVNEGYIDIIPCVNDTLFLIESERIDIYSSVDFKKISNIPQKQKIKSLVFSPDKIFIKTEKNLKKLQNPLLSKTIRFVGDPKEEYEFLTHFILVAKKSNTRVYDKSEFIISPLHINLLHIYAYYDNHQLIEEEIEHKNTCFFSTTEKWTPFTLSMKLEYAGIMKTLLNKLCALSLDNSNLNNLLTVRLLETDLCELNLFGFDPLHKLYTSLLIDDSNPNLRHLCDESVFLPKVILSDKVFCDEKEFGIAKQDPENANAVKYLRSLTRFDMVIGSQKSLDFIYSLKECSIDKVFTTKIIIVLIEEK